MIDMLIKDQLKCTTKMIGMIAISGRNRNPFFWPMIYSTVFSWIFLPRVHFQDVLCKQVETGGLKMRPSAIQNQSWLTECVETCYRRAFSLFELQNWSLPNHWEVTFPFHTSYDGNVLVFSVKYPLPKPRTFLKMSANCWEKYTWR